MSRTIAFLIGLLTCSLLPGQKRDKYINVPYDNRINPFLDVLGLVPYRVQVRMDSVHIDLKGGPAVVLFFKDKLLWNIVCYDKDGPVDTGTLKDGTGSVRLRHGQHLYAAEFKGGVLDGPAALDGSYLTHTYPIFRCAFKEGLLHGERQQHFLLDPRYVNRIETYEEGYLTQVERYGRRHWLYGKIPFLTKPLVHPEFLCSRALLDKGMAVSSECFVKKCKRCW